MLVQTDDWFIIVIGFFWIYDYTVTSANAKSRNSVYSNIPANADGSISVKLLDEQ